MADLNNKKLSESDVKNVAGGTGSQGFAVGCNDCNFTAYFDANSYKDASDAAAAHERETGHIVYLYNA